MAELNCFLFTKLGILNWPFLWLVSYVLIYQKVLNLKAKLLGKKAPSKYSLVFLKELWSIMYIYVVQRAKTNRDSRLFLLSLHLPSFLYILLDFMIIQENKHMYFYLPFSLYTKCVILYILFKCWLLSSNISLGILPM